MHQPIPEQGRWLRQVVTGYFAYHAVPTNGAALGAFRLSRHRSLAAHAAAAQPEGPASRGSGCTSWPTTGSHSRESFIPGPSSASPSNTRGRSRMREFGPVGSVRGAPGNGRPYRESEKGQTQGDLAVKI